MWELNQKEGWALKSWCFWTVVQEKTLESPLNFREIKLSILNPEYSLEGLMLKLKFQYFVYLMRRANSLEKTLMLGKTEDRRRRGRQRMRWLDSIPTQQTWIWANSRRLWRTGKPWVLQSLNSQRVRRDLATKQQQKQVKKTRSQQKHENVWHFFYANPL